MHRVRNFELFLSVALATALIGRHVRAQDRKPVADTVRQSDSLAQQRERDRTRVARERLAQLLREAGAHQRAGDRRSEGVSLRLAGNVYLKELNVPDSALALFQQARGLARTVGNQWDELNAEYNIRFVQSIRLADSSAYSDSALAFWHKALATVRSAGDRTTEGEVLLRIGPLYQSYDSSLTYIKQATQIARELGDRWAGGPGTFYTAGLLYLRLARLDSAEVYLRENLIRVRKAHDRSGEGWALNELAAVYSMRGRYDSSLVTFHKARDLFRTLGDGDAVASLHHNIGQVQVRVGRPDSALVYYQQALAQSRKSGLAYEELNLLNAIGYAWLGQARADSALAYLHEGLRLAPRVGDRRTEAYILGNIGEAEQALGQSDSALVNLRRSLALHQEVGTRDAAASVLGTIGTLHLAAGRRDSALADYGEGLALARAAEVPEVEVALLGNLGDFYYSQQQRGLGRATAYYDSTAVLRARLAAHAGSDPNKVSYAELGTELYAHWALAWLGREAEVGRDASRAAALAASERGRAQALLDLLRRGQSSDSSNSAGLGRTELAGTDLVREGLDLITSVRAMGTPTLTYMATKDTLLTWLILPSGEITVERQAVPRDSVARVVAAIRAELGADEALGRAFRAIEPPGAAAAAPVTRSRRRVTSASRLRASGAVLFPDRIADRLPAGGDLVIVPSGPIALVSFAALPSRPAGLGVEALGMRFAIRYAPSLTTLRVVAARASAAETATPDRQRTIRRGALVVGNPTMPRVPVARGGSVRLPSLPGAGREGRSVANALGVTPLTGTAATERVVRARMADAAIVHLATHGFAYSTNAKVLESFVALAPDSAAGGAGNGLLTVGEVIDEGPRLTADLVVLSACQTGLGNLTQAEGTVGLQRAFLARGARSVLVSLWSVSDDATELLMRRFYTHWLRDTDAPNKPEALRRAQVDVRRTPGFAAPRYWAGFQLVGAR